MLHHVNLFRQDLIVPPLQPLLDHMSKDHLSVTASSGNLEKPLEMFLPAWNWDLGAVRRPRYLVDAACRWLVQAVRPRKIGHPIHL